MRCSRTSSRRKSSEKGYAKELHLIEYTTFEKKPPKKKALYLEHLIKTEDGNRCTLSSSAPWARIPIPNLGFTRTSSLTTTRDLLCRHGEEDNFKFFQTPSVAPSASRRIPNNELKRSLMYVTACTNTKVACALSPLSRIADNAPWKIRISCCGCREGHLAGRNPQRDTAIANLLNISAKPNNTETPKERQFRRRRKDRFLHIPLCQLWQHENHWYHVLSMQRMQALSQLEIIPQRLRGNAHV